MAIKTAASDEVCGLLHKAVTENLLDRLVNGETIWDSKSGEFVKLDMCSPATLSVIIRFLKDNDIKCVSTEANAIGKLREEMESRRSNRPKRDGDKVINFQ